MKATLILLGACIVAPFAGAFAGASINTTPLRSADDPLAAVPQHETDFTGNIAFDGLDIPDHYPLVTRHGTIPVEELMFHGRLDERYPGWADSRPAAAAAPGADDERADTDADNDADNDDEARRAADIARLSPVEQPAAPLMRAALVPAEPALPSAPRGMLTAVGQPALPGGGRSGGLALIQ